MSEHTPFTLQDIAQTWENRERMRKAVETFNHAMETQNYDVAREVAEFVLGDEEPNADFGAGFQLHCLRWLTNHYRIRFSESEDDSEEERVAMEGLMSALWKHKWIMSKLPWDIGMTREEIAEANDYMREIYSDYEFSQESVEKTLTEQSISMGDAEAARAHFAAWQDLEADDGSDCPACVQDTLVRYYHFIGDYERALDCAAPILSGDLTCGEVPHVTYEYIVGSLYRLGRHDEARAILEQAIDLITQSSEENIRLLPMLIFYQTQLGLKQEASELLDEYGDAIVNFGANNRLYYLEYLTCVAPFNDEALTAAQEVAQQFDERNGNTYYQDVLALMFGSAVVH